jgi:hypothetical protein
MQLLLSIINLSDRAKPIIYQYVDHATKNTQRNIGRTHFEKHLRHRINTGIKKRKK